MERIYASHGKLTVMQRSAFFGLLDALKRQGETVKSLKAQLSTAQQGADALGADLAEVWRDIKDALKMDPALAAAEVAFRTADATLYIVADGPPPQENEEKDAGA